jgi:acyl-CoA reductase-like NAD-dependent aldehyde dehydrogenase
LKGLLDEGKVIYGGQTNAEERYIAPTILEAAPNDKIMDDEIFGPLLPILVYEDLTSALQVINSKPKPLALYVFSKDKKFSAQIISEVSFGGGCVNDTIVHPSIPQMPFGGVGTSGFGAYHGEHGFKTFSHMKSVFYRSTYLDFTKKFRFPPYRGKLSMVRRFLR